MKETGDLDLEVQIKTLKERIKELEDINRGHQELNGFLRVEIATWHKISQEFESAKNLLKGYQSVIKDLTNRLNKKK
tara:strand:+ start:1425 stop:1655 length:231 start_codon:yes stop_codon:yes gene_type:complete